MKKLYDICGFTLVELLITLAIASILLAVAAPSFTSLISSNAASGAANRFQNSLAYARSEAVTRSIDVVVCSKAAGANACSGLNSWVNGWLVYIEGAGTDNADGEVNADDLILTVERLDLNLSVAWSVADAPQLNFNNLGRASPIALSFVGTEGNAGKSLSVSGQGTISISDMAHQY
jgi:prepilin-type N-terminal cleavage/methylation domain-containing protein